MVRKVRASYGIMHVLQLRHIAVLKHLYPSADFKMIGIPKGKLRGGTLRLGEGELLATMMQGMPSVVRDVIVSSDMCVTVICCVCRRLLINCDCPPPKLLPTEIQVR